MSIISTFLLLCLSEPETLFLFTPDFSVASSMDGRPRPTSGCSLVWWLLTCTGSQKPRPRLVITQSKALRYQIRLRSMKVNISSPNHLYYFSYFFTSLYLYYTTNMPDFCKKKKQRKYAVLIPCPLKDVNVFSRQIFISLHHCFQDICCSSVHHCVKHRACIVCRNLFTFQVYNIQFMRCFRMQF